MINDGAAQALQQRGASLLPVGVVHVRGQFEAGDVVVIENAAAGGEVARGIARYSSAAITRIKGRQSPEIAGILGYDAGKEVVHRDFMLLATDAVEESAAK
jgi:glutamate 5-kinase